MNLIKSICVYCGSSTGNDPRFADDARLLSRMLVNHGITLVNGGGSIGIMGIMADAVMAAGGKAVGVIPVSLKDREVAHLGMTELIVTPDMHSRKLKMVNLSDAFIGFPGGFGTLDEVFETLTWAQLHLHQKPILLYNPLGYYDALLTQVDRMVENGFLNENSRDLLMSTDQIDSILPMLSGHRRATGDKWVTKPR